MKYLPNILTLCRILFVPLFIMLFLNKYYVASAAAVVLAGATDAADGYIARKFNSQSVTGQVLDPLADKLMQLAVIIVLWLKNLIPIWAIGVIAGKEILMICGGSLLYFCKKKTAIPAMWYGKATTCLFYFTMLYIIIFHKTSVISVILILITVMAMIFSLVMYFIRFVGVTKKTESVLKG